MVRNLDLILLVMKSHWKGIRRVEGPPKKEKEREKEPRNLCKDSAQNFADP